MINCYDKDLKYFMPFHSLTRKKKDIIASLIKEEIGHLLRDLKIVKQKRNSTAKMFEAITNKTEENYAIFGELNYCLQSGKQPCLYLLLFHDYPHLPKFNLANRFVGKSTDLCTPNSILETLKDFNEEVGKALAKASKKGKVQVVKELIQKKSDINYHDKGDSSNETFSLFTSKFICLPCSS